MRTQDAAVPGRGIAARLSRTGMRATASKQSAGRLLQVRSPSGEPIAVALRRSHRARRLVLSVDPAAAAAALVIPPFVSVGEAQAFLESRRDWLASRLAQVPAHCPFVDGAAIPFLGEVLTLRHRAETRCLTHRDGAHLVIGGAPAFVQRRATDWLKQEARARFGALAAAKAAAIGRPAPRVAVADPKRQWGSCSADGRLRLSWRLVMAPEMVVDYVVAHEVAHLKEMNHSHAFWTIVAALTPHMASARIWLRRHGQTLLRYG